MSFEIYVHQNIYPPDRMKAFVILKVSIWVAINIKTPYYSQHQCFVGKGKIFIVIPSINTL